MGNTADLKEYNGELSLASDGAECRGAGWYASYFNKYKIESILQEHQPIQVTDPSYLLGVKIPAIKFSKANDYIPRFTVENLTSKYLLGYGRYSLVWMTELGDAKRVALKQFDLKKVCSDDIWKERDFMIYLKNKRICNIIGAFFDQDAFIAMEMCYGSLRSLLPEVSQRNAVRFAIQLAEALQWCHEKKIIHCDLNPSNILVTTLNNAVLSDFGQAILVPQGVSVVKAKVSLGEAQYQDDESNTDFTYSFASDMFSFGCVFYELLTHQCLQQYVDLGSPKKEHHKKPNVRNSNALSATKFQHENLEDRIVNTTGKLQTPLLALIIKRSNRWSASTFLQSAIMRDTLHEFGLSQNSLDNDTTEMVTIEQRRIKDTYFCMNSKDLNDTVIAAFHGIYYDEKDVYENVPRNALVSFDAQVAGNVLKSTNSVPKLIDALAKNDPFVNAQLHNLISQKVDRKTKPIQHSKNEVSHQAQTVREKTEKTPDDVCVIDLTLSDSDDSNTTKTNRDYANNSFSDNRRETQNFECQNRTEKPPSPKTQKTLTQCDMTTSNVANITLPHAFQVVIEPDKIRHFKPADRSNIRDQNMLKYKNLGLETIDRNDAANCSSKTASNIDSCINQPISTYKYEENEPVKLLGSGNYKQKTIGTSNGNSSALKRTNIPRLSKDDHKDIDPTTSKRQDNTLSTRNYNEKRSRFSSAKPGNNKTAGAKETSEKSSRKPKYQNKNELPSSSSSALPLPSKSCTESSSEEDAYECQFCSFQDLAAVIVEKHMKTCNVRRMQEKKDKKRRDNDEIWL